LPEFAGIPVKNALETDLTPAGFPRTRADFSGKCPVRLVKIPKKVQLSSLSFLKKNRKTREDSGKCPAELWNILKNDRVTIWRFQKTCDPAAGHMKKIRVAELIIPGKTSFGRTFAPFSASAINQSPYTQ
jgi:hypothetical protein